jgi:predicted PurR-regulated permease PerM
MTAEMFYKRIWTLMLTGFVLWAFFSLLGALQPILLPFLVAMLLAYLCDPLADKLERSGASRVLAASVITLSVFALLFSVFMWVGPLLAEQLAALLQQVPKLFLLAQQWGQSHTGWLNELRAQAPGAIPADVSALIGDVSRKGMETFVSLLQGLLASSAAFLSMLSLLLITPLVTFYLLRDWDAMVAKLDTFLPISYRDTIRAQLHIIDATLAGYLRGQVQVMLMLTLYYGIVLSLLSVPYALILALITGLLIIIPYIGTLLSVALALGMTYTHGSDITQVWWVAAAYGIGQVIESQILTPKMIGKQVGLHPLWVLFGLLAGGALFGFVGVLLAVPVTAVIGVLVRFAFDHYMQQNIPVTTKAL